MLSIYEYTDYKKYLADWFIEKKTLRPSFSYNLFAKKAGFVDKGFFHNVIHGKRELTKESLVKVSRAIGHTASEAIYFENLVFFNKSSDTTDKSYYFEKMNSVKCSEKNAVAAMQLRSDQFDYFSSWYISAVRSLIDMFPFSNDYEWLSRTIIPNITPKQAKNAVRILEKLNLIERQKNGTFRVTSKTITTGPEVASLAVSCFHKKTAELAANSIDTAPSDKRDITGLTLGISEYTYTAICEELRECRRKIIMLAEQDRKSDRTYQLNLQLFPLTRTDIQPGEEQ